MVLAVVALAAVLWPGLVATPAASAAVAPCVATMTPSPVIDTGPETFSVTGLAADESFTYDLTLNDIAQAPLTLQADSSGSYSATTTATWHELGHSVVVVTGLTSGITCTVAWDTRDPITWNISVSPDPAVLGQEVAIDVLAGPCGGLAVDWTLTLDGAQLDAGQVTAAADGTFQIDLTPEKLGLQELNLSCDATNGTTVQPLRVVTPPTTTTTAPAAPATAPLAVSATPALTG
jgi:hypothetical protein